MENKNDIKIVLDSDVLIHFSKGGILKVLPEIFPQYKCIILDVVYDEIKYIQKEIDNYINTFHNFEEITFSPKKEMLKEYSALIQRFGRGESACMSYCKYNKDIIGSSNIRDVKDYCEKENITYLTTMDFLYYAYKKHILSAKQCNDFIKTVREKGSKLPDIDIERYISHVNIF